MALGNGEASPTLYGKATSDSHLAPTRSLFFFDIESERLSLRDEEGSELPDVRLR